MKYNCKLMFSDNMLSDFSGDILKVFGLDITQYLGMHYNKIFSEETSRTISGCKEGHPVKIKASTIEKVILNAEIFKKDSFMMISFNDAPPNLNPIRATVGTTPFSNLVVPYLKSIHRLTGEIASKKNIKTVEEIKNVAFQMAVSMWQYLKIVSENDLKNADISFTNADLWEFMHEIRDKILSIKNVEIENELLSCFYTYINKESLYELIIYIVTNITLKGERAYIRCLTEDDSAIIRIANHKYSSCPDEALDFCEDESYDDICAVLTAKEMASRGKIELRRRVYKGNMNEFLLYFKTKRILRVCEDE